MAGLVDEPALDEDLHPLRIHRIRRPAEKTFQPEIRRKTTKGKYLHAVLEPEDRRRIALGPVVVNHGVDPGLIEGLWVEHLPCLPQNRGIIDIGCR